jgi:DNA ligase-1
MLLSEIVETSAAVGATRSRLKKVDAIAEALRRAEPHEVPLVVRYLSGELRQRRTGIGWASLRDLPPAADEPTLDLTSVDAALERAELDRGTGSTSRRKAEVAQLFGRATADEQQFLVRLVSGELRQGALAGIMADAIARASGVEGPAIRRAAMLAGDLALVAVAALGEGEAGVSQFGLQVGRPLQPMLAQTATSVDDALARIADPILEWKIDGVRVQIHRSGDDVAVFTRTLDVITERVPEVVDLVRALPVRSIVLDGEAISLRPDGRPRPFQETASRMATRGDAERLRDALPLTTLIFDALHLDGEDLLDRPATERHDVVVPVLPAGAWVPRLVPDPSSDDALGSATAFFEDAVAHGYEGVVVKSGSSLYEAGRRGAGWLKVKPRHTLDLVVLAAEWGHGRRQGWLSNLHLGARDGEGGYVMLGKTFKGLTDELLAWQTEQLLAREVARDGITVHVRPELVVEIAFDGIQTSVRYPGGMALRFARVLRYRTDKTADEADTIETLRRLHAH